MQQIDQSIPLKCIHRCSEDRCQKIFKMTNKNMYSLVDNPNYDKTSNRCDKYGQTENSSVYIEEYLDSNECDIIDCHAVDDNEIKICFDYPLQNSVTFDFKSKTGNGFTLIEIIDNICKTYEKIYKEEEETCSENCYYFKTECTNCKNYIINNSDLIEFDKNDGSQCSICIEKFENQTEVLQLPCKHYYHKECIEKWLDKNTSCPLCRKGNSDSCDKCNQGKIINTFIGKVIPDNLRVMCNSGLLNRNKTNGKYGIWGHDIDDLSIESLSYNPSTKHIGMSIGS